MLRHLELRERLAIVHRSSIPRELPIRAAHRDDSSNVSTRLFRVASSASPSTDSGAFPFSFFSSLFAAAFSPTSSAAAGDSGSRRASVVAASCHCSIVTCASNMTIRARFAAVRAGLSPSPPPEASAAAAAAAGDSGSRRASVASVVASASCHFSDDTSASNWSIRDAREVVVVVVVVAAVAASAAAVPISGGAPNPSHAPAMSREGAKSPSGATPNIASWARADAAAIASAVAAAI